MTPDAFVVPDGGPGEDAFVDVDGATDPEAGPIDGGSPDAFVADAFVPVDAFPGCMPSATDYTPRVSSSSTDTWPACITDTATAYPRINATVSTIPRVDAYEAMRALIFSASRNPTSTEFTDARTQYQITEGLDSRVVRREDEHFAAPAVPGTCTNTDCRCEEYAAANPDRCVGPATLRQIIGDAFRDGQVAPTTGAEPSRIYAARIEAALTWFFYQSSYKESLTCTTTARDCDSAWAYYTGGAERGATGRGLAFEVQRLEPNTHERIIDSLLAVRCWRDLDGAGAGTATNLTQRELAREQQDRALLRGVVAVIQERLALFESTTGDEQLAHLAWLRTILAPITVNSYTIGSTTYTVTNRMHQTLFDRTIREVSPSSADAIITEIQRPVASIDGAAIAAMLDAAFTCP